MSAIGTGCWRCQSSIAACSPSRSASKARFRGASSWTSASKPLQHLPLSRPTAGRTSSSTKWNKGSATSKPRQGIRTVISFLVRAWGTSAKKGLMWKLARQCAAAVHVGTEMSCESPISPPANPVRSGPRITSPIEGALILFSSVSHSPTRLSRGSVWTGRPGFARRCSAPR